MTLGRSEQSVQLNPAAVATERRAGLPDQFSALINAWRIVATAAVFIGHATKPDILFDQDIALLGRATIPTFLIISGFFTTLSLAAGGRFLKKVAKRYYMMWSVFVPASILVFFMDLHIIAAGSPFVETFKYDADFSWQRILLDIFNLFTFSGEYWAASTMGQGVFSNHAIWFIDYMMAYTVMTAAIYLLSGWLRVAVLLAAILLAGVPVLLLAPLWFAGVFAFEVERRSFHANGIDPGPWHPVTLARRHGMSLTLPAAKALACAAMAAALLVAVGARALASGRALRRADHLRWQGRQNSAPGHPEPLAIQLPDLRDPLSDNVLCPDLHPELHTAARRIGSLCHVRGHSGLVGRLRVPLFQGDKALQQCALQETVRAVAGR